WTDHRDGFPQRSAPRSRGYCSVYRNAFGADAMNLLAIENVDAGYGRVQILEDVSVQLSHNETLAVLGPNGSGKSTLVKTVMGLTTLHRGRIAWNTKDIASLPVHARTLLGFGYVPQT